MVKNELLWWVAPMSSCSVPVPCARQVPGIAATVEEMKRYEKINRLQEEGYRYANRKVRKLRYNNRIPWSPE